MPAEGEIEKLVVRAWTTPDYSGEHSAEFRAAVNPAELSLAVEMEYDAAQGSGTTGSRMEFKKVKPGDMNVTFFLDGTGANGTALDVQAQIDLFMQVTGYNGDIHRPNYLKVAWGSLGVKRCVLKSANITYKLFRPNGIPLRATIAAVFTDNSDDQTRVAMAQDQSPDLTHSRIVQAGDTLPGLCTAIYGDPRYYVDVAAVNELDQLCRLSPGMRLFFPPLER